MVTADELRATVKHYKDHGDMKGARNYIRTLGKHVKGFDVVKELYQLENPRKPKPMIKEDKPKEDKPEK